MEFVTRTLNSISKITRRPTIYPVLLLLITTVILVIYQRFYSMSCDNDGCMKWECTDPKKEFEYKLFSKSGVGIAKSVIFSIIVLGFIGILLTFVGQLIPQRDSGNLGDKFANMVEYRPHIISFTFSVGFIYFLLVWWSRTCGLDDKGAEIPVILKCNGDTTEWKSKYTKISGLLVFFILFFSFLEIWNILIYMNVIKKGNWSYQSWNQREFPHHIKPFGSTDGAVGADFASADYSDNLPNVRRGGKRSGGKYKSKK